MLQVFALVVSNDRTQQLDLVDYYRAWYLVPVPLLLTYCSTRLLQAHFEELDECQYWYKQQNCSSTVLHSSVGFLMVSMHIPGNYNMYQALARLHSSVGFLMVLMHIIICLKVWQSLQEFHRTTALSVTSLPLLLVVRQYCSTRYQILVRSTGTLLMLPTTRESLLLLLLLLLLLVVVLHGTCTILVLQLLILANYVLGILSTTYYYQVPTQYRSGRRLIKSDYYYQVPGNSTTMCNDNLPIPKHFCFRALSHVLVGYWYQYLVPYWYQVLRSNKKVCFGNHDFSLPLYHSWYRTLVDLVELLGGTTT